MNIAKYFLGIIFMALPVLANAVSTVSFQAPQGANVPGDTFYVDVFYNGGGSSIHAIQFKLSHPENIRAGQPLIDPLILSTSTTQYNVYTNAYAGGIKVVLVPEVINDQVLQPLPPSAATTSRILSIPFQVLSAPAVEQTAVQIVPSSAAASNDYAAWFPLALSAPFNVNVAGYWL